MKLIKRPSLAMNGENVSDILNWKMETLTLNNLPIESGISDYIALAVETIQNDIEQLKNYRSQIDAEMKARTQHLEEIKEDVAEWFNNQGIDRLEGIKCSSITITKGKEQSEDLVKVREFTTTKSKDEINEFLAANGMGQFREIESKKIILATKDKIRINSKKK